MKSIVTFHLLAAVIAGPWFSEARADDNAVEDFQIESTNDPGFGPYFSPEALAAAWQAKDSPALTDIAITLATGERTLLRPHSSFNSEDVFGVAIRVASNNGDKATLTRIQEFCNQIGKADLAAEAQAMSQLDGVTRSTDATFAISLEEEGDFDCLMCTKDYARDIQDAKLLRNRPVLEQILEEINSLDDMPKDHIVHLTQLASAALDGVPVSSDGASLLSQKLSAASRDFNVGGYVRDRVSTGANSLKKEGGRLADDFKRAHGLRVPPNGSTQFVGRNKTSIRYTIRNTTSAPVRFRLPTGKNYTLEPGRTGSYRNTDYAPNLRITVRNSGRSYSLSSGAHKFWTMSGGRVGFDKNYR